MPHLFRKIFHCRLNSAGIIHERIKNSFYIYDKEYCSTSCTVGRRIYVLTLLIDVTVIDYHELERLLRIELSTKCNA